MAAIIERALDLLIEKTLQRRFAKTSRPKTNTLAQRRATTTVERPEPVTAGPEPGPRPAEAASPTDDTTPSALMTSTADATKPSGAASPSNEAPPAAATDAANAPSPPPHSRHLPSATRRTVLERDGLRCTWVGPDGTRCESRAWLEHDHITPRGQGGSDDPANIRIRCRAHNQLAAEQAYGQQTIARAITQRRAKRQTPQSS